MGVECFSPAMECLGVMAAEAFEGNQPKAKEREGGYGFTNAWNIAAGEDVLGHPVIRLFFLGVHVQNGVKHEKSAGL